MLLLEGTTAISSTHSDGLRATGGRRIQRAPRHIEVVLVTVVAPDLLHIQDLIVESLRRGGLKKRSGASTLKHGALR